MVVASLTEFLSNIGTNPYFWVWFVAAVICVVVVWFLVKQAISAGVEAEKLLKTMASDDEAAQLRQKALVQKKIRNFAISGVLALAVFAFFFLAHGAGTPTKLEDARNSGWNQLVDKAPKEPTKAEIEKDSLKKKPKMLRRQDMNFDKEKDEADKYFDQLRRKYPKKSGMKPRKK